MARFGGLAARGAGLLGATALIGTSLAVASPVSAATVTRAASCAGYDFHRLELGTFPQYTPSVSEVWSAGPDATHVVVCNPDLPQGALVTKVQFTVADRSTTAQVDGCGLYRTDLRPSANPAAQELAAAPPTGVSAAPGVVRLVDTTIGKATIDHTRYAYWLQCRPGGNGLIDGLPQTGLRGASVSYRISTTLPATRAVSCAGYTFVERSFDTDRMNDADRSEIQTWGGAERVFSCTLALPQGAVMRKIQVTLADRTGTGAAKGCGVFRSDLRSTASGAPETMAGPLSTGVADILGAVRLSDATIQRATIDNTRYAYWIACRLDATGTTDGGDPQVGLRGASVRFTGGKAAGAVSCGAATFHPVDGGVDKQFDPAVSEAAAKGGDGFLICKPVLPHGMTMTKVQFTIADRGSGEVRYCGLYQVDLRTSSTGAASEVALLAATGLGASPGVVRLTDPTIDRSVVNNERFGYWLQCQTSTGDAMGSRLLAALRGASVSFRQD